MKIPTEKEPQKNSPAVAHVLLKHTNARGEVSPGLEAAIKIVGARLSAQIIPPSVSGLESVAVLLHGANTRVLWVAHTPLGQLVLLAKKLKAGWIANWDGFSETKNLQPLAEAVRHPSAPRTREGPNVCNPEK